MNEYLYTHGMYILRIIIACFCGICIGYERKNRAKEAGVRTHCMVACGAALMMVVSKYAFADLSMLPEIAKVDVSRIASSIVSGVGFLGAGMIFVRRNTVSGLTTAAGIWVTAGIGMAIGGGLYIEGIATTIIVLLMQIFLHNRGIFGKSFKTKKIVIYDVKDTDFLAQVTKKLEKHEATLQDVSIKKATDGASTEYRLIVEMPSHVSEKSIIDEFDMNCEITSNY
ncbi:MAG: MgtC/SapB family protein [Eubacteriales bacterium]|nr:MgtC/SapB family protein [Eubacteriales bacterium]